MTAPNVALVAERIRDARANRTPLRITAAGTWLDAGRPCTATERLDLSALGGIVAYEPDDLTLTAGAATSLAEIGRITASRGQWLTLDAMGAPAGTLGATVATASSGPLSSAFGTPRDHVLGCEFIIGTGDVVQAGGRVVKNVAGFDLTRLVTGAWGTLGAITELTVRLRARPEEDRSIAIAVSGSTPAATADVVWQWLRASEYTPLAAELISPALARKLALDGASLLVRIGGNGTFVRAAESAVASLGAATPIDLSTWHAFATAEMDGAVTLRVSALPSRAGAVWARASAFAERAGGFAHATLARGIVRCVMPAPASEDAFEQLRSELGALAAEATVIGERLPAALWSLVTRRKSSDGLAGAARRAFDPDGILNAGIL